MANKPRWRDEHELELLQTLAERKMFTLDGVCYHLICEADLDYMINKIQLLEAERDSWRAYALRVEGDPNQSLKGD